MMKTGQIKAIKWSRQLLAHGRDLIIFDTETTSANPREAKVLELAVINGFGETVYHTLINPGDDVVIPQGATDIHGITRCQLANAPKPDTALASFYAIAVNSVLVGYNYSYDAKAIETTAIGYPQIGGEPKPRIKACMMKIWAHWHGDWCPERQSYRWVKLVEAAEEAGLETDGAHSALEDCLMTLGIMNYLAAQELEEDAEQE